MNRVTFEALKRELHEIAANIKRHTEEAVGRHAQEIDEKLGVLQVRFDVCLGETSDCVEGVAEERAARFEALAEGLNARIDGLEIRIAWLTHIAESPLQSGEC